MKNRYRYTVTIRTSGTERSAHTYDDKDAINLCCMLQQAQDGTAADPSDWANISDKECSLVSIGEVRVSRTMISGDMSEMMNEIERASR